MRELKQEDPSVLELGLELELQSEDVDAAVAAVAAASEGQIPCSCCDELFENADQLHSHQMGHHSLSELSLALITLRGLDLSLVNGAFEVNVLQEEDDSSHLRNILLESVDRPNDCDSESTVTVNSEARMAISPPSSPIFSSPAESYSYPAHVMAWNQASASTDYSMSFENYNQFTENQDLNLESARVLPEKKGRLNQPVTIGQKKSSRKCKDPDTRQFFCHLCDRRYKKKSHLERHFRVHTGVRPYGCPMCDRRFAVRSILIQHIRVHTGERPFSCNICSRRFPQKSGLMTHMMLHNGKPFKCEYCVKSFVSNHKLMLHQRCHGDLLDDAPHQGPYCCSSCEMRFFTTGALAEHTKVHVLQSKDSSLNKSNVSKEGTITEEAARAAVSAIPNFPDESFEVQDDIPEFQDDLLDFQDDMQESHDNFLDIVKDEIFEEDEASSSESFFCEARWGGLEDMYIEPDLKNVY